MAIEQHLVWNACAQLAERGERVTVRAVRAALGGGSPNEITPLVRSWRDAHLAQERERAQLNTMPPEVRARVEPQSEQLLASLWLALSEHSARQLEQMRGAYETATEELRQELTDSQGLADDLAAELAQAQQQAQEMSARLDATTAERARHEAAAREAQILAEERWRNLEAQGAELRELRDRLAEAQQRAARLEVERDHLRAALDAARADRDPEAQAEREADCARLRQERDALADALERSEAEREAIKQRLKTAEGHLAAAPVRETEALRQLEDARRDLGDRLEQTLAEAEADRARREQELARATAARDKLHGHLNQVSEELRQLQASATVQQVQKLERELARAQETQRQAKAALDAGARKIQELERILAEERQPSASARLATELQSMADNVRQRYRGPAPAAPG